jgi:hypothetical protein
VRLFKGSRCVGWVDITVLIFIPAPYLVVRTTKVHGTDHHITSQHIKRSVRDDVQESPREHLLLGRGGSPLGAEALLAAVGKEGCLLFYFSVRTVSVSVSVLASERGVPDFVTWVFCNYVLLPLFSLVELDWQATR